MNRREEGFTLIELLVSLAILAVALGVLFGAISSALDRTRRERDDALAGSLVQSLLARAGTEKPLRPGETGGTYSNGMQWRLKIAPFGNGDDAAAWHMNAFAVRATVSWSDNGSPQSKSLATLRFVAPPAKSP
ncbi:MAG: type II secretion system protein [Alphaproteobacteria bacterium]|nr:type II secretion system protein [Alphaproteobacteria bacterium]MBL7099091.1 type II secretion system protein [Alphaproteobacteria bacterium]